MNRSVRTGAVDRVREAVWALRRHGLVLAVAGVVLLGTPAVLLIADAVAAPPKDPALVTVERAAEALRADFAGGVDALDPGFVRKFSGADDESMTGTVARLGADGSCWGFTVSIPAVWLSAGAGYVVVGDVERRDPVECEP